MQENATERMSQISLNYRKSPLSVSHHAVGSLHAGDRVPNVAVEIAGGDVGATSRPATQKLFRILNPDRFTLLFFNLTGAEAVDVAVQETLSPWKDLFDTGSIMPVFGDAESAEQIRNIFGPGPSLTLVRPRRLRRDPPGRRFTRPCSSLLQRLVPPVTELSEQEDKCRMRIRENAQSSGLIAVPPLILAGLPPGSSSCGLPVKDRQNRNVK